MCICDIQGIEHRTRTLGVGPAFGGLALSPRGLLEVETVAETDVLRAASLDTKVETDIIAGIADPAPAPESRDMHVCGETSCHFSQPEKPSSGPFRIRASWPSE
jgi:hypothetical protein